VEATRFLRGRACFSRNASRFVIPRVIVRDAAECHPSDLLLASPRWSRPRESRDEENRRRGRWEGEGWHGGGGEGGREGGTADRRRRQEGRLVFGRISSFRFLGRILPLDGAEMFDVNDDARGTEMQTRIDRVPRAERYACDSLTLLNSARHKIENVRRCTSVTRALRQLYVRAPFPIASPLCRWCAIAAVKQRGTVIRGMLRRGSL